jgi:hypothetical protein
VLALTLAAAAGLAPAPLVAQDEEKEEQELNRVWRIEGLQTGFCVQLMLDPAKLDVSIPRGARPLRADAIEDLSPVLRTVVTNQPEYASWTPSRICMYYMQTVDVGSLRVSERDPQKAPMLGVWTISAAEGAGNTPQDVVLRLFTNSGRLERAAEVSGLDLRKVESEVKNVPNEDDAAAPPIGVRRSIRLKKTTLTWEGRQVDDSTKSNGAVTVVWRADSKRRGPMTARLALTPEWTKGMAGSLRVEGDDDFADAVKASPVRFVGPAVVGGKGELAFGR